MTSSFQANRDDESSVLESLRRQINETDRALLGLLARRKSLVVQVSEIKQDKGLSPHHPGREADLITSRRAQGLGAGLDPDYVEDLFRTIIQQSRLVQFSANQRGAVRPGAKVLVIDGEGAPGRAFAQAFTVSGYDVRVIKEEEWPQGAEWARTADLALIVAAEHEESPVEQELTPRLSAHCVICRVIQHQPPALTGSQHTPNRPVLTLHTFFAHTNSLEDQMLVTCSAGNHSGCQWVLDQLCLWGVECRPATEENATSRAAKH